MSNHDDYYRSVVLSYLLNLQMFKEVVVRKDHVRPDGMSYCERMLGLLEGQLMSLNNKVNAKSLSSFAKFFFNTPSLLLIPDTFIDYIDEFVDSPDDAEVKEINPEDIVVEIKNSETPEVKSEKEAK